MHRFRKRLGLATLASVALSSIFALTPAAHAATNTFDGNTFSMSYIHFGASGTDTPLDAASVTGSASAGELANFEGWKIDTVANTLSLTWNKDFDYHNDSIQTPFRGFRISDTGNHLADILNVAVTNPAYKEGDPLTPGYLIERFDPLSKVSFDANNIYVNLNNSMWHNDLPDPAHLYHNKFADKIALSVNFQAAPIPEPEAYAMLLAGLGLISAIARRRRGK